MKKLLSLLALLLCVCLLGMTTLAEETEPAEEVQEVTLTELTDDTVMLVINGQEVTWKDVQPYFNSVSAQYSSDFDITQPEVEEFLRAISMEYALSEIVVLQKATEMGIELTDEEISTIYANVDASWEEAVQNYIDYFYDVTEETTEEEMASFRAEAENYYMSYGYSPEALKEDGVRTSLLDMVAQSIVKDVTVTEDEVEAIYQEKVAADKELYENDLAAYAAYLSDMRFMNYYAAIYGISNDMEMPYYKPAGYRNVKHILLPVDEELMNQYNDLQARFEEQSDETADEEYSETVTAEEVSEAKAAIFASKADIIEEINTKIADGADFDALIAEYALNEDGTPSDPGMVQGDSAVVGYEVCTYSADYVPEFTEAAMSIDEIGGVSAPYLSSYGIHIVKYVSDADFGPVEMTDDERAAAMEDLLYTKQNELYSGVIDQWIEESTIEYTGATPSYSDLVNAQ